MKEKVFSILALLCITASSAWAQTTADIGRVIAADGKMYKTVTLANKVSTASGVVAYVGTGGSVYSSRSDLKAIAISLADAPGGSMKWGPTGEPVQYSSMSTDYSTLLSQMEGAYTNQYAVGHTCSGHPALQAAWNYSTAKPSGASTWFMPCIGQWNLIVKALTGSGSNLSNTANSDLAYNKVSAKLTAAGASSLSNNHYWLSNEYSNDEAWEYMPEGYLDKVGKGFSWAVRPIFCFASASNGYVVEYNANGGSGAPAAQSKTHGTALTLSSTVPTRDGYTFAGWNTKADGSGTPYSADGSYTDNDDIVLYAQWTENTATLTDGDDLSALSTYAGKTCTVTYTRSFTAGKPSTVCLPFAYTPKSGETFYTFTGINEDDGNYTADMTEVVSPLVANTPYLFMPTGNADFSGTYAIPDPLTAGTTTSGDWTFVGTYTEEKWDTAPTGIYGFSAQNVGETISQGEFVKVGAYVRVKPMRCYLKYKNGGENYAGARAMTRAAAADEPLPETIKVRLIGANGEVTAIGTLHTQTGEVVLDGWYTLDGTRLSGQPTRKGIYVNNGKKVIIK